MKLVDFINSVEFPVVVWRVSNQNTSRLPACTEDCSSILDDWGLLDLEGEASNDCWTWDGKGCPEDYKGNRILFIQAYPEESTWKDLVNEWNEIPF